MDPVSLALGIAPLCLSAITGARLVRAKLKLLCHHDRELRRFRKRLKGQVSIFLDECQLLLQEVADGSKIEAMLEDLTHPFWKSSGLDESLKRHLGRKHDDVRETTRHICDQITALNEELQRMQPDQLERTKLRETLQKAQDATKVMLGKSKFDESMQNLVESISEFRRLRKVAKAFQKPRKARSLPACRTLPGSYERISQYSASFYRIFIQAWSCVNPDGTHSSHTAKLLLDTDSNADGGDLRFILGYEMISGRLRQNSLLLLRVQSEDLTWVESELLTPEAPSASSQDEIERPVKARRVRFEEPSVQTSFKVLEECRSTDLSCPRSRSCDPANLCDSKDLCSDVFKHTVSQIPTNHATCIGYLDSANNLRHRLLTAHDRQSKAIETSSCSPMPLSSILGDYRDAGLSVPEQLRLALRLAQSVLQFHSTPWWRQYWRLADISFFSIDSELSRSLSTLHIDARLSSDEDSIKMRDFLEQVPQAPSNDDILLCGIRNITLHSLGAALLQIGRWETLDAYDVVSLRKKAAEPSKLGPRYDELTSKCLYCDFGFGSNLDKPQLRSAFFQSVVCELEQMVGLHDGLADGLPV